MDIGVGNFPKLLDVKILGFEKSTDSEKRRWEMDIKVDQNCSGFEKWAANLVLTWGSYLAVSTLCCISRFSHSYSAPFFLL